MKKYITLFLTIVITVLVIWFLFFKNSTPNNTNNINNNVPINKNNIFQNNDSNKKITGTELARKKFSTNQTLSFITEKGEVITDNFYKNASFITQLGDAELKKTNDYQISFIAPENKFIITITTKEIEITRKKTEQELMEILKVNQKDFCKLNITEFIPYQINPGGQFGTIYPTICPSPIKK